eukprot:gene5990-7463_t
MPIVYIFKSKLLNYPFHSSEQLIQMGIDKDAYVEMIHFNFPYNLDQINDKNNYLQLISNFRDSFQSKHPTIDHAIFEYHGGKNSLVFLSLLHALSPLVEKTILIIGDDSYLNELEQIIDEFLMVRRIWEPIKIDISPELEPQGSTSILMKLESLERNSPTYQLYQYLDSIQFKTSPNLQLFNHHLPLSVKSKQNINNYCKHQPFLLYQIPENIEFGQLAENLIFIITQSIFSQRPFIIDSTNFKYGSNLNQLFLSHQM